MSSIRDTLARKRRRRAYYDVPIADIPDELRETLAQARRDLLAAQSRNGGDGDIKKVSAARTAVAEADTAIQECFHRLWFTAMTRSDYEALVAEQPEVPEGASVTEAQELTRPFYLALLAASAEAGEGEESLTPEEWDTALASWSMAEEQALFGVALRLNSSLGSGSAGKG